MVYLLKVKNVNLGVVNVIATDSIILITYFNEKYVYLIVNVAATPLTCAVSYKPIPERPKNNN
jgi:hypothetical protein